ncbi:protein-disulfide reductase DsbD [Larsenimonas rhizosphaerae]|uniref:Protein-disulfide reductase DsbD n=1 Tax=Larsenimonas rhizosphaerae TaxID=2944682 RepID=A0AA42CTY6_9GAMM|nr:protein-disulfide reductase DsbD [Larsenimonas rhizosphaerae]MCX2523551.1 protein-disulfide reductase DsbD [Larsenimonas rhizosphaerae]
MVRTVLRILQRRADTGVPAPSPVMTQILASCLLLLTLLSSLSAQAGLFDGNTTRSPLPGQHSEATAFLPVDQAFSPSAWVDQGRLFVRFTNADGYYLYKRQFAFDSKTDGVTLGSLDLPAGTPKHDDYLGDIVAYYHDVTVSAPIRSIDGPLPETLSLVVHYQGCADAGLCYPPETRTLTVDTGGDSPLNASPQASTDRYTVRSEPATQGIEPPDNAPRLWSFGLYFLAGLGLTFTPCVLPMLPILASLIAGRQSTRRRALSLSSSYVTGMVLTYTVLGILLGLFGASLNLQARLQSPWVLGTFSLLFVIFALWLLDLVRVRLPGRWQQRTDQWQTRLHAGGPLGLAGAGALSTLVVSPCISAPLAGIMLYLSATADVWQGALALGLLGAGMGLPLIIATTLGAHLLPRSGAWMQTVKHGFAILMLGMAIWLSARWLPGTISMALWGILALMSAVTLWVSSAPASDPARPRRIITLVAAMTLGLYGSSALLGALAGGSSPLMPLAPFTSEQTPRASSPATLTFTTVTNQSELQAALEKAGQQGKKAMVDVYADWCISCQAMEHELFPAPPIHASLKQLALIRLDVTDNSLASRKLLKELGLFGPPGLLFYDGKREIKSARLIGEPEAARLQQALEQVLAD